MLASSFFTTKIFGAKVVVIAIHRIALADESVLVLLTGITRGAQVLVIASDAGDFPFDDARFFAFFAEIVAPTRLAGIFGFAHDRFAIRAGSLCRAGFSGCTGIAVRAWFPFRQRLNHVALAGQGIACR